MKTRRIGLVLLSSMLLAIGLCSWLLHWDAEEYAVDEAVIREVFSEDNVSFYVVLNTTESGDRRGISNFHAQELGLAPSARLSYSLRNIFQFQIPAKLNLPHPYKLVDQKMLDLLYKPERQQFPTQRDIAELIRKSWGVITLSRVGFDRQKVHAVIYAQLTYCGLCGQGTYLYLSKENGQWHIIRRAGTWIS